MLRGKAAKVSSAKIPGDGYQDIRPAKLSHRVAGHIRSQIFSGQLTPGSKLPGESELLTIYKVSRPTLREALRIIEAESLIAIGPGMRSGALVLGPNSAKVAEYATLLLASQGATFGDLHAARRFFEPKIIRSLDQRRLEPTLQELRKHVTDIEAAIDGREYVKVVTYTKAFHVALARAAANKTIGLLIGIVQNISDDVYVSLILGQSGKSSATLHANMKKTAMGYSILCNLLEQNRLNEAANFWQRYMQIAQSFLNRTKLEHRRIIPRDHKILGPSSTPRQLLGIND